MSAIVSVLSTPIRQKRWLALVSGVAIGLQATIVRAEPPETAPAPLRAALIQLDAATNQHNAQSVLQFYSPNFTSGDGLNRQTLQQSLVKLWTLYPNLTYRTELKSWKTEGNGIQAETITRITGTQKVGDRDYKIDSTLQANQRFENQVIVRQEVINERNQVTSGANPPQLKLTLPEQVTVGQEFALDAIVQEPLGNDLLLGATLEEPVKPEGFLNAAKAELELLPAGGIFKTGRAPTTANQHWISAIVVRQGGITMITQRLRVVGK